MRRGWLLLGLAGGCVRHDTAEVCVRGEGASLSVRASFDQDLETGPRELSCVVEARSGELRVRTRGVVEPDWTPGTTPLIAMFPEQVPCVLPEAPGAGEHVLVYRGEALRVSLPGSGEIQCFPSEAPRSPDTVARQVFPEAFDTGVE